MDTRKRHDMGFDPAPGTDAFKLVGWLDTVNCPVTERGSKSFQVGHFRLFFFADGSLERIVDYNTRLTTKAIKETKE